MFVYIGALDNFNTRCNSIQCIRKISHPSIRMMVILENRIHYQYMHIISAVRIILPNKKSANERNDIILQMF